MRLFEPFSVMPPAAAIASKTVIPSSKTTPGIPHLADDADAFGFRHENRVAVLHLDVLRLARLNVAQVHAHVVLGRRRGPEDSAPWRACVICTQLPAFCVIDPASVSASISVGFPCREYLFGAAHLAGHEDALAPILDDFDGHLRVAQVPIAERLREVAPRSARSSSLRP